MNFFHYKNDFSFDISLTSQSTGETMDASMVKMVKLYTRKNGRCYAACFGNGTLINNGNTLTVVVNNGCLEPGVLSYTVIMDIPDAVYPDRMKHIEQTYVSDIELVKGNGESDEAVVEAFFGTTIDSLLEDLNTKVDNVENNNTLINSTIVSIQEKDAAQDASINNIEDIISGIHGDESAAISRLNSSVNNLETDVNNLNTSLGAVNTLVERMDSDLSDLSADLTNNYYTKTDADNKFQVKGDYALKSDLDNINLTEYVKNSSLSANYPTNSSLSSNYAKKSEIQDFVSNSSVSSNYTKKTDLNNYPTNSSLSSNYVTKDYADQVYVNSITLETSQDEQNDYIAQTYLSQNDANLNYVSYENIDEIIINTVDNNYRFQDKVIDLINTSTAVKDISTMSTNISNNNTNIQNVSTRLKSDYLTAHTVNADFVKNTSLNTELNKYVLKSTAEETYLTSDDISTFKPIVFCTQEEYDTLVENDQVDANTVYMLSGDQTGGDYLTPNDVSNFVTTDDISTFITADDVSNFVTDSDLDDYLTADDASIYVKEDFGSLSTDTKKTIVKYEDSNNLGELSFYIQKNVYDMAHSWNGNMLKFDSVHVTQNTKPYNLQRIAFNGRWGNGNQDANHYGSITFMRGISNSSVFNNNLEWGSDHFKEDSDFKWATIFVDDSGFGLLKYSGFNRVVTRYATAKDLKDVSNYVSTNYASKNDISTFITSNDVSIYATTSYVDTQIGNIQNILQTI